jgi:hypothetical protein
MGIHSAVLGGLVPVGTVFDQVSIVCLMDAGRDAALVMRDSRRARVLSLSPIGHWLKKAWGYCYRFCKYRFWRWIRWAAKELFSSNGAIAAPRA